MFLHCVSDTFSACGLHQRTRLRSTFLSATSGACSIEQDKDKKPVSLRALQTAIECEGQAFAALAVSCRHCSKYVRSLRKMSKECVGVERKYGCDLGDGRSGVRHRGVPCSVRSGGEFFAKHTSQRLSAGYRLRCNTIVHGSHLLSEHRCSEGTCIQ